MGYVMAKYYYNTNSMKQCAENIDKELSKFNQYKKDIDSIVNSLNQNWDDDQNRKYCTKYRQSAAPICEELYKTIQQFSSIMNQCSKKYSTAIDNGNSFLSL